MKSVRMALMMALLGSLTDPLSLAAAQTDPADRVYSFDMRNVALRAFLESAADTLELELDFPADLAEEVGSERLTLVLEDVPMARALDIVTGSFDLRFTIDDAEMALRISRN